MAKRNIREVNLNAPKELSGTIDAFDFREMEDGEYNLKDGCTVVNFPENPGWVGRLKIVHTDTDMMAILYTPWGVYNYYDGPGVWYQIDETLVWD